jgi:hypothetical protein
MTVSATRSPVSSRSSPFAGRAAASSAAPMFVPPLVVAPATNSFAAATFSGVAGTGASAEPRAKSENRTICTRSIGRSRSSIQVAARFACPSLSPSMLPDSSIRSVTSRGSGGESSLDGGVIVAAKYGSPEASRCTRSDSEGSICATSAVTTRSRSSLPFTISSDARASCGDTRCVAISGVSELTSASRADERITTFAVRSPVTSVAAPSFASGYT